MRGGTTILSDFLSRLGVPHTGTGSDGRFHAMPFKSLFGFSRALTEYGVDNEAWRLASGNDAALLPVPFIAQRADGFVIVDAIRHDAEGRPARVDYTFYHRPYSATWQEFLDGFTGVVLTAHPCERSCEPDYRAHLAAELIAEGKKWVLVVLVAALGLFGFIRAGVGSHLSLIFLLATDLAGLAVTYMLVQKTLKVNSHTADKVCGILKEHGCDTVLEQKASTFFGIFSWSEVGIAYFSVSTLVLLIFPGMVHWLALINGCCLPFTVWSISYQRFRIHTWCTLCVITQCLLWLQFLCFILGGWWSDIFPFTMDLFMLVAAYGAVLLAVNRLDNFIKSR